MGLLDDAIRDHLDLKRRRGSDPTEIARMEREALGPVRRGPEPFEAPYHRRPTCDPSDMRVRAAAVAQPTQAFDALSQATQAFDPLAPSQDELEPVGVAAGNMLSETPDFLAQTPEHDRLWFEQKPPQEVDF
jgi:hypothetical protein